MEVKKVIEHLLTTDNFSKWLGIEVLVANAGECTLAMNIREEMLNGFGIVHGGVTYSLADSALAVASNSHNRLSVALEVSASYPVAVQLGDRLEAQAQEISKTNKIGVYQILVRNQKQQVVLIFKGTVYRTSKILLHE